MIVVIFVVLTDKGFIDKQLPFLYLMLSLVIFVLGSGKYSADALLFKRKNKRY
jgi:putative oxidoreductase